MPGAPQFVVGLLVCGERTGRDKIVKVDPLMDDILRVFAMAEVESGAQNIAFHFTNKGSNDRLVWVVGKVPGEVCVCIL